jgi:hypothetical protein
MSNLYNRPNKTERVTSVPHTELQTLATGVNFAINFRIQRTHLPKGLHSSSLTNQLLKDIREMQDALAVSIRADYERQRGDILSKREKNRD